MNIGKQIQGLRKQMNITQEVLAAEMGVSVAAVSKWENGNSMPDMNGLELLKKIKERNSKIKVIMVTADTSEETKNQAIRLGADAYITKPFLPQHIKVVIDNHISVIFQSFVPSF